MNAAEALAKSTEIALQNRQRTGDREYFGQMKNILVEIEKK